MFFFGKIKRCFHLFVGNPSIVNSLSQRESNPGDTNVVQDTPVEGMTLSPKNKKPPPFELKQCPSTFLVSPAETSFVKMLIFPFPGPKTPTVAGGGCALRKC